MTTTNYTTASDLGWLRGEWPRLMSYQGITYQRGQREVAEFGGLIGYTYNGLYSWSEYRKPATDAILLVGND